MAGRRSRRRPVLSLSKKNTSFHRRKSTEFASAFHEPMSARTRVSFPIRPPTRCSSISRAALPRLLHAGAARGRQHYHRWRHLSDRSGRDGTLSPDREQVYRRRRSFLDAWSPQLQCRRISITRVQDNIAVGREGGIFVFGSLPGFLERNPGAIPGRVQSLSHIQ